MRKNSLHAQFFFSPFFFFSFVFSLERDFVIVLWLCVKGRAALSKEPLEKQLQRRRAAEGWRGGCGMEVGGVEGALRCIVLRHYFPALLKGSPSLALIKGRVTL